MGVAPNSPVADWVVQPRGDHYGTFVNQVGGGDATVTRTTPKTIYDPTDGLIHDVPAGSLAVNPWSAYQTGGVGYAAVIEEARTNYLTNSYGAANASNMWTGWVWSGVSPVTRSIVAGVYGSTAQRIVYDGVAAASAATLQFQQTTAAGTFAAAETAMGTMWLKGSRVGCTAELHLIAWNSGGSYLGGAQVAVVPTVGWSRFSLAYASLPANTSHVLFMLKLSGIDTGDTYDLAFDACQLEKSSAQYPGATSYIPTTTVTATRDLDRVLVPTAGWSNGTGMTLLVVSDGTRPGTFYGNLLEPSYNTDNRLRVSRSASAVSAGAQVGGVGYIAAIAKAGACVAVGRFQVGAPVSVFADGARADSAASLASMPPMAISASLGGGSMSFVPLGGPVARATVYDTALTDEQLAAVDMTTDLLNGNASIVYEKSVGVVSSVKFMPRG